MFYIFIITILTGIDQWTKYLIETQLKPIGAIPIVNDIFHLTYARNTGAAFSILRDKQAFFHWQKTALWLLPVGWLVQLGQKPMCRLCVGIKLN